jgi:hypothetical protein
MNCTLCGNKEDETVHLPLYVIGSEGIEVCLYCKIILTKAAQGIMTTSIRVKVQTYKQIKSNNK